MTPLPPNDSKKSIFGIGDPLRSISWVLLRKKIKSWISRLLSITFTLWLLQNNYCKVLLSWTRRSRARGRVDDFSRRVLTNSLIGKLAAILKKPITTNTRLLRSPTISSAKVRATCGTSMYFFNLSRENFFSHERWFFDRHFFLKKRKSSLKFFLESGNRGQRAWHIIYLDPSAVPNLGGNPPHLDHIHISPH